jgi:hypothetical protein
VAAKPPVIAVIASLEQAVDLVRDGDHRVQLGLELCEKAVHP